MRIAALLLFFFSYSALAAGLPVRVLLEKTTLAEVKLSGAYSLWSWNGRIAESAVGDTYRLLAGGKGIELACDSPPCARQGEVGNLISFVPKSGQVEVNGRSYRGYLRVLWRDGEMLLINKLDIEDYLRGVLPGEVPASFPYDVLRAQAILARTYTLSRLGSDPDYDLCDTSACQVYLGKDAETSKHDRAVAATKGRILAYHNKPIAAVYHADSGGKTAAAEEVWGSSVPYLQERSDPWTLKKHWRLTVTPSKVQAALADVGYGATAVRAAEVVSRGESGRITAMAFDTGSGRLVVRVPKLTRVLYALGLPSSLATLRGWTFDGRGSGHGVGLSQWGARGLARKGWNYREILAYYYPHVVLTHYQLRVSR